MARLVIVDPAYASTVGHHGELNRPLLAGLTQAGWRAELWADVLLEAEGSAPGPLRGVFSGCGYGDPRHWRELGGMVRLGRMLEQQLSAASADSEPVAAWVAHSLLPFQLLGLARHLAQAPRAQVLISLMFAPGETLEAAAETPAAITNCRVALAALARACGLRGHRLRLAFPSQQQLRLYEPLLEATGLSHCGLHPAVVGAGCMPTPPSPDQPPLVLLHWGDHKAGKGQREALAVLHTLMEQGVPGELAGWGWLFHQHSNLPMPPADRALLERAEAAGLGLAWLSGEVESDRMGQWLARCPLALLAYDPQGYRQRSSGLLWQWAACRAALALPALAVGYGEGWLAAEARELGVGWHTPPPPPQPPDAGNCLPPASAQGMGWLAALVAASQELKRKSGSASRPEPSPLLSQSFSSWVVGQLS